MKRFLILSILIAFVTVSCAGPNKVRWTKPDFREDQFDKDRGDCIQAVKSDPEQKLKVWLAQKGYKYRSEPEPPSDKEKSKTVKIAKTVGEVLLFTALLAVTVAAVGTYWALESHALYRHP